MGPPCIDCSYYIKPGFWKRYARGVFAETCAHPQCRDDVDGSPRPCVTMRLNICHQGQLFRPAETLREFR